MEFIDLKRQYNFLKEDIDAAISSVLESTNFIQGDIVSKLEEELVKYSGSKYCISVANGTDALEISQKAIGVGPNDEVIIPSFTWVSTAETIAYLGAKPIFCDVDPLTFTLSIQDVKNNITEKTKAIVPVSIFGQMPDLDEFMSITKDSNIKIIEDGAQSFGAKANGRHSCSIAHISTTSFFPSKPLGSYGDGGAIFTNDQELHEEMRLISRHGQISKNSFKVVGRNSRLDSIQAAILLEKLKIFTEELKIKENIALAYKNLINSDSVQHPFIQDGHSSTFAIYTIKVDENLRDDLSTYLREKGVPNAIYYSDPLYLQDIYRSPNQRNLPVTNKLAKTTLSLPMHPYLSEEEVEYISDAINSFFDKT